MQPQLGSLPLEITMKNDVVVTESLLFELSIPRSINLDTMTTEEFEKTLSGTFEEEARGHSKMQRSSLLN